MLLLTQGRIWHALQLYQSMLTILVPCKYTPSCDPPCARLILVSTLGVYIRPQWTVRYPQSFYIFTMQVDLACPLGIYWSAMMLSKKKCFRRLKTATLIIYHVMGCFTIRVPHLSHFWWKMKCFVIPQHTFLCVMNKPYIDYIKLLAYRLNLSWIQLK